VLFRSSKVLRGGTENELLANLKRDFAQVMHIKPPASRADSAELYVIAKGFRGASEDTAPPDDGDPRDSHAWMPPLKDA
jgi:23S rRNA (uridine2552-2'-O)-methyltransferase